MKLRSIRKEKVKEFFKPEWEKLFVLFIIPPAILFILQLGINDIYLNQIKNYIILFPFNLLGALATEVFGLNIIPDLIISFFLFLSILWWYALSCSVIYIYNRYLIKKNL